MSGYMLDSNVLIDVVREPYGPVARTFSGLGLSEISISPIVSGELRFGMEEMPQARSNPRTALLLESLRVDTLEAPVDIIYGKLRLELKRRGKGIFPNDYWIAAHAMSRDAVLVTGDRALHDAGIDGLRLQDWRIDSAVEERN